MPKESDVTVSLPAEYFDALSEVIAAGLKHAPIAPKLRHELQAWWSAEKELIEDSLQPNG